MRTETTGIVRVTVRDVDTGEVKHQFEGENTMTKGVHELIVTTFDAEEEDSIRETITQLAIGDSDASAADYENTSLNNEIERLDIADYDQQENDAFISTFIAGPELVGDDIREVGLFTSSTGGTMVNHHVFEAANQIENKTSQETVSIDIILQWRAA